MSHFTTIKTEIYDLDILTQTLHDLGIDFKGSSEIEGPGRMNADIVASVGCHYCLGFRRNQEKRAYEIKISEDFARQEKIKETINTILTGYAYRKILYETRRRGFALVQEEKVNAGTVKLVLRKVA
jgi:hypothetical protein